MMEIPGYIEIFIKKDSLVFLDKYNWEKRKMLIFSEGGKSIIKSKNTEL